MTTPPTPPTDNLAAEGGLRSEMSERETLAAEIEEVLRENMSRGTSGRYIVSYGITPEDFADALADLLAARDRRVRGGAAVDFAQWVATNRAYNGSDHQHGQSLYNECLNGVLPTWATDWANGAGDR